MTAPTLVSGPQRPSPWGLIVALGVLAIVVSFGAVFAAIQLSKRDARAAPSASAASIASVADAAVPPSAAPALSAPATAEARASASASAGASARRPHLAATTPNAWPSGAPVPTTWAAPSSTSKALMGGARVNSSSLNFELCSSATDIGGVRAALEAVRPQINACFAATQHDPPIHEIRSYDVVLDAHGKVTRVMMTPVDQNPSVPRLDGCLGAVLQTLTLPAYACTGRVSFGAECDPGFAGQCGR